MLQIQRSFSNPSATLFLVATPIGNLSDISLRAIETLKNVAVIASEDTRVTKKLCNHFEITTPLISYHEHNKIQKLSTIIDFLERGENVALVSDAGMPLISDPGNGLVQAVVEKGYYVVPIPGANAALTALIASGLAPQPFYFHGFLDRKKSKMLKELTPLENLRATLIFYESPHRIKDTLETILEAFGNRQIVIARELTKLYEEFTRGDIKEILSQISTLKGEVVLIVEGATDTFDKEQWFKDMDFTTHVDYYINEGLRTNDAIKKVANDLGKSKQEVYKEYHNG